MSRAPRRITAVLSAAALAVPVGLVALAPAARAASPTTESQVSTLAVNQSRPTAGQAVTATVALLDANRNPLTGHRVLLVSTDAVQGGVADPTPFQATIAGQGGGASQTPDGATAQTDGSGVATFSVSAPAASSGGVVLEAYDEGPVAGPATDIPVDARQTVVFPGAAPSPETVSTVSATGYLAGQTPEFRIVATLRAADGSLDNTDNACITSDDPGFTWASKSYGTGDGTVRFDAASGPNTRERPTFTVYRLTSGDLTPIECDPSAGQTADPIDQQGIASVLCTDCQPTSTATAVFNPTPLSQLQGYVATASNSSDLQFDATERSFEAAFYTADHTRQHNQAPVYDADSTEDVGGAYATWQVASQSPNALLPGDTVDITLPAGTTLPAETATFAGQTAQSYIVVPGFAGCDTPKLATAVDGSSQCTLPTSALTSYDVRHAVVSKAGNAVTLTLPPGAAVAANESYTVFAIGVVNPAEGTYPASSVTVDDSRDPVHAVAGAPGQYALKLTALPDIDTTQSTVTVSSATTSVSTAPAAGAPLGSTSGDTLTVTARDVYGNPIGNETVTAQPATSGSSADVTPGGTLPTSATACPDGAPGQPGFPVTGADGTATFTVTDTVAEKVAFEGIDLCTTSGDGGRTVLPTTATVTFTAGAPVAALDGGASYVTPPANRPQQVAADGVATAAVTVHLVDQFGNLVTGDAVQLTTTQKSSAVSVRPDASHVCAASTTQIATSSGTIPAVQAPASAACTDARGNAGFLVSGSAPGSYRFTVSDLSKHLIFPTDDPDSTVVTFLGVDANASTVTGPSAQAPADGSSPELVTVHLVATGPHPILQGVAVSLTSDSTTAAVAPTSASPCAAPPVAGSTDCQGNAYFQVTDTTPEQVTLTAVDTAEGVQLTRTATITFSRSSSLVLDPTTIIGSGSSTTTGTVTLRDAAGNRVAGATLTGVTVGGQPASTTGSAPAGDGCPDTPTDQTDCNGQLQFTVGATGSGVQTVAATLTYSSTEAACGGTYAGGTCTVTVTAPLTLVAPPASATLTATPSTVAGDGLTTATVLATVSDASGRPIAGLSLGLTASTAAGADSAAQIRPLTPSTNSKGQQAFGVSENTLVRKVVTFTLTDASDAGSPVPASNPATTQVTFDPNLTEAASRVVVQTPAGVAGDGYAVNRVQVTLSESGQPLSGHPVVLTPLSQTAKVAAVPTTTQGCGVTPPAGTADCAGHVAFTVTDTVPEDVEVLATDLSTGTTLLATPIAVFTPTVNQAGQSTIGVGTAQVAAGGPSAGTSTVTVTLLDAADQPISGHTVQVLPGSPTASLTPVTQDARSDGSGAATFTVADTTAETLTLHAVDVTSDIPLQATVRLTFTATPIVTGVSPNTGPSSGGGTVTVSGYNLAGVTGVSVGGVAGQVVGTGPNSVTATVPAHDPGTYDLVTTSPTGSSSPTRADLYGYTGPAVAAPVVTGVSPDRVSSAGGTVVTITGTDLGDATSVTYDDAVITTFGSDDDGQLTFTAPPGLAPGQVTVTVTTPAGTSQPYSAGVDGDSGGLQVYAPPAVTGVGPASGGTSGGGTVTISGTDLTGATTVDFGTTPSPSVQPSADGTSVVAVVPPHPAGSVPVTVVAADGTTPAASGATYTYVAPDGVFVPLTPARILDTRVSPGSPVGPRSVTRLTVAGRGGVPAEGGSTVATAVVLNVTALGGTANTYLSVYPDGADQPKVSNSNPVRGQTVARLAEVKLPADGVIDIYNAVGSVHLAVDVEGYVTTQTKPGDGLYDPVTPVRALDTRTAKAPLTAGTVRAVPVTGVGQVPKTGVAAVIVNLTAVSPTAGTFLAAYPAGGKRPLASAVNAAAGQTVANRVMVPVGPGGVVDVYDDQGSVNVLVDVVGWFTDGSVPSATGLTYHALTPVRILDTRTSRTPLGPQTSRTVPVPASAGLPTSGPVVAVVTVTGTGGTAPTFLTAYADGSPAPTGTSDVLLGRASDVPNVCVVPLGPGGMDVYNSAGTVGLVVDLEGYYA